MAKNMLFLNPFYHFITVRHILMLDTNTTVFEENRVVFGTKTAVFRVTTKVR